MSTKTQDPVIGDGSLHVGDRVVYPNQGICRITGVDIKQIAGQNWEVVTLSREEDGATVMVPKAKVMGIGLRKVADVAAIDRVFDELANPNTDPQLDWKVRHRENADRMTGGGLFGTVEVLKGLHALSRVRPLPPKERELYDNARHLLVGEIAAAMNIPLHVAEDNLDYALWPPEGMTRKGRPLPPATLAMWQGQRSRTRRSPIFRKRSSSSEFSVSSRARSSCGDPSSVPVSCPDRSLRRNSRTLTRRSRWSSHRRGTGRRPSSAR